jgi:hypothetical protein
VESQAISTNLRRSGRIPKQIPIILSGVDADGRQFSEHTTTLVLSRHGATILAQHKVIPEQEVYLRLVSNNREIEVRICGEIGEREDGHIYGVAFADPEIDFWEIKFPPPEPPAKDIIPLTLECFGCRGQTTVNFDATEIDVYIVNEGTLRYCEQCALSTVWKIAAPRPAPAAPSVSPAPESDAAKRAKPKPGFLPEAESAAAVPVAQAMSQPNRRSERRMKANCNVCIRIPGSSDEVVPCADMSRGGFSFHSSRHYPEETMIQAAVPYTPSTSIFVPAQIANVRELQKGKLFRYGVAYLRAPKK